MHDITQVVLFAAYGFCNLLVGFGLAWLAFRRFSPQLISVGQEADVADSPASTAFSNDAIADSSPRHLKEKRDERVRLGEDADDTDSQIVGTKSMRKRQEESDAVREAKLDKWMPGARSTNAPRS